MRLNLWQRLILIVGGVVLLIASVASLGGYDSNGWLATVLFVLGIGAFVLAAQGPPKAGR